MRYGGGYTTYLGSLKISLHLFLVPGLTMLNLVYEGSTRFQIFHMNPLAEHYDD